MSTVTTAVPNTLKIHVTGVREALLKMQHIPRRVRHLHLRKGLNAAGGVLKGAAQQYARRDTGALAKSIRVKVKIPDASFNTAHHGKPAYVVVGPGRRTQQYFRQKRDKKNPLGWKWSGFGKAQRTDRRIYKDNLSLGIHNFHNVRETIRFTKTLHADSTVRMPARYAHLVEKGTRRTKAYPFLGRAIRTHGAIAQAACIAKIMAGLKLEAAVG